MKCNNSDSGDSINEELYKIYINNEFQATHIYYYIYNG